MSFSFVCTKIFLRGQHAAAASEIREGITNHLCLAAAALSATRPISIPPRSCIESRQTIYEHTGLIHKGFTWDTWHSRLEATS